MSAYKYDFNLATISILTLVSYASHHTGNEFWRQFACPCSCITFSYIPDDKHFVCKNCDAMFPHTSFERGLYG